MINRLYPYGVAAMTQGDFSWSAGLAQALLLAPEHTYDAAMATTAALENIVSATTVDNPGYSVQGETVVVTCDSIVFSSVNQDYRYVLFYSGDSLANGVPLYLLDLEATVSPGGMSVMVDLDPAVGLARFGQV